MSLRITVVALAASAALAGCSFGGGPEESYRLEGCTPRDLEGRSVARVWNEAILDAIRRDTPAPTVHARNLFHVSAAMWDAWAAYDPDARGYFVREKLTAKDTAEARETAISFAAYRVLLHRYSLASGLQETFDQLAATMRSLCLSVDFVETEGDSPASLGNRIAAKVIAHGADDGAREALRYADPAYTPVNPPLVVAEPEASMQDPNRWQPLALAKIVAQNGVPIPGSVQTFIGPHWGHVRGFALPGGDDGLPLGSGPPPLLGDGSDADYQAAALEVVRYASELDPGDGAMVDASPRARGANPLGTNDGRGHPVNPSTGEPYAPNPVPRGDFGRVLAEFWADGPNSETPPGHWNTIANDVSDRLGGDLRIGGTGARVDRLEWDVKLYLALNGAVHDAAVAAWGVKSYYDFVRPISMIRFLGGNGQSSDPDRPAYDPEGLPLVPGLAELVTVESTRPGGRHERLAGHVGEIAVRGWLGPETGGVGWVRAVKWAPYQMPTFVTPAFAGYVSGHSTFSRASAEVLTAFTGSEFFPGGLYEWPVEQGALGFESGPSRPLTLQWATYYDAADDAGISRLYGGIHIAADDFEGRRIGSECGRGAWELARRYFEGSV